MSPPYRVLHLDSGRTYRGGQRQLFLLAKEQQAAGMDLHCLVSNNDLASELRDIGVPTTNWRGPAHPVGWFQLWTSARRGRNLLHAHDSRSHGALAVLAPRRLHRQLIVHRRIDDSPRDRRLTRWKYRIGHIICVSKAIDQVMGSFGVTKDRRSVHYSATPLANEQALPRRDDGPQQSLRLLSIGALVPHKGHGVLLNAIAQMEEPANLVLLGDGPLRAQLEHQALDLCLESRVRILPYTPQALRGHVEDCEIYVQPSITEGLGSAVLDAMALGRPVVASSAGGLPELVSPQTGWLTPPGDSVALAELLDTLARSRERTESGWIGRRRQASTQVRQCHSPRNMLAGVRSVYDAVL